MRAAELGDFDLIQGGSGISSQDAIKIMTGIKNKKFEELNKDVDSYNLFSEQPNPKYDPQKHDNTKETAILLQWDNGDVGVPHVFTRSALFHPGQHRDIEIKSVPTLSQATNISASRDLNIFDEIVFLALLSMCYENNSYVPSTIPTAEQDYTSFIRHHRGRSFKRMHRYKYTELNCSIGDILATMGRKRTTSSARNVFESLKRLACTQITIESFIMTGSSKKKKVSNMRENYFSGSLIQLEAEKVFKSTGCSVSISINKNVAYFFKKGNYSSADMRVIRQLGRDYLAIWLYLFMNSHEKYFLPSNENRYVPQFKYNTSTLQKIAEGEHLPEKVFDYRIKKAIKKINQIVTRLDDSDWKDWVEKEKTINPMEREKEMEEYFENNIEPGFYLQGLDSNLNARAAIEEKIKFYFSSYLTSLFLIKWEKGKTQRINITAIPTAHHGKKLEAKKPNEAETFI